MNKVVMDASAILAYVLGEPGSEVVGPVIRGSLMSTVNFSEVLKKTLEHNGDTKVVWTLAQAAEITMVDFDEQQAQMTAALWVSTKSFGLSMADRACLALGIHLGATIYTADADMTKADLPVKSVLIRRKKR